MKTLSFSRPLLLMIVGLPGAGKSFFAKQFSETFSAPVISADRIRFELFEKPSFSRQEYDLIKRLFNYQLEELLKTKNTIILDGNCDSLTDRKQLAAQAKKAGYNCMIVWVQTDEASAKQRSTKRSTRHSSDKLNPSLTDEQFNSFAKRFTPPKTEPYVVISGKHSYNTQAKMVLRKLAVPRANEAEQAHRQEAQSNERPTETRKVSTGRRNIRIIR